MFEWFLSINSLFSGYHDKEIITLTLFIPSLFVLTSLFLIALYLSSFLSPLEVSHLFSYCHYSFHSSYPLSHSLFLSRYSPSVSSATMISPFFPLIAIKFGSSHEHVVYYFQSSVMSLSLNYPFYFTQSSYTAFSRLSPISPALTRIIHSLLCFLIFPSPSPFISFFLSYFLSLVNILNFSLFSVFCAGGIISLYLPICAFHQLPPPFSLPTSLTTLIFTISEPFSNAPLSFAEKKGDCPPNP